MSPGITLGAVDLEAIRSRSPLGQNVSTTYISLPGGTVLDMAGQRSEAIDSTSALVADFITADFVPPELTTFTLDKNLGYLVLTFSENVQSSTLQLNLISLSDGTFPQI